jgi:hypothetical protein
MHGADKTPRPPIRFRLAIYQGALTIWCHVYSITFHTSFYDLSNKQTFVT